MIQPFRFFRGEFNGELLYKLVTFLNGYVKQEGFLKEISYQNNFQWKLENQKEIAGTPIRKKDVYDIGFIAGVDQLRGNFHSNVGSIWFTPSYMVDGKQRSNRGFIDMGYESFMFRHIKAPNNYPNGSYSNPISKNATKDFRMTFVPKEEGVELLGYIYEDEPCYKEDGKLIPEAIHKEKPVGKAYTEFYGLKYLHFEEKFLLELPLPFNIFKLLIEVMQMIRRKGTNIETFLITTKIMCENYVYNIKFKPQKGGFTKVIYTTRQDEIDDSIMQNRERRFIVWQNTCKYKFKMFHLEQDVYTINKD